MPSTGEPLEVTWISADGQQLSWPACIQVEVAAGLMMDLAFASQDQVRVVVRFNLTGERPTCDPATKSNARFVIIPLDEASLLLGVAEPSAEPAALMPVASTPVLLRTDGIRIGTRDGFLSVRGPHRTGADVSFVPDVGDINACVLQVRAASETRGGADRGEPSLGLSILRLEEDSLTIVIGPTQAGADAI